jgi:pimeloyl-ACP methyl ester carboxylesterase
VTQENARQVRKGTRQHIRFASSVDPLTCADVVVYGARGAFEPFDERSYGVGPTLHGVVRRMTSRLTADGSPLRVDVVGVPYPANTFLYHWSRHVGVRNVTELLIEDVTRCTEQLIVLIGLSQGAEVIRRALARLPAHAATMIAAVVLLGDPTRRPGDPWTHGTTDPQPGIAARYAAPIPEDLSLRTWGYALEGDEIVANHTGLRGLLQSGTHTLYERNHEGVQDQAASFISERLRNVNP